MLADINTYIQPIPDQTVGVLQSYSAEAFRTPRATGAPQTDDAATKKATQWILETGAQAGADSAQKAQLFNSVSFWFTS